MPRKPVTRTAAMLNIPKPMKKLVETPPVQLPPRIHTEDPIPGHALYKLYKNGELVAPFPHENDAWKAVIQSEGTELIPLFKNHWRIENPAGITCIDI